MSRMFSYEGELVRHWRTRANVFLLFLLVGRTLGRTLGNIIDDYRSMAKDWVAKDLVL